MEGEQIPVVHEHRSSDFGLAELAGVVWGALPCPDKS